MVAEPFAVAFECSGRAEAAAQALGQLDRAGTLVFVGTGSDPAPVNQNRMIILELEALGAFNYSADGFRPALDLLDGGTIPVDLLVEADDVPLDGVMEAMEQLARGEIAVQGAREPGGDMTGDDEPRRSASASSIMWPSAVDASVLDEDGRAALLDFYGEVFGWVEGDNSTETGQSAHCLHRSHAPVPLPAALLRRLPAGAPGSTISGWRSPPSTSWWPSWTGPRPTGTRTTGSPSSISTRWSPTVRRPTSRLTNAYIGFLIPLMIELQHIAERPAG